MYCLPNRRSRCLPPRCGIQILPIVVCMFVFCFLVDCSSARASFVFGGANSHIPSSESHGIGLTQEVQVSKIGFWDIFDSIFRGSLFNSRGEENHDRHSFLLSSLAESGMSSTTRRSSTSSPNVHFVLPKSIEVNLSCEGAYFEWPPVHLSAVFLEGLLRPPISF